MYICSLVIKKIRSLLLPIPVKAGHCEYSAVFSAVDETSRPSERLLSIAIEAVKHARGIDLEELRARMYRPPYYPDTWPGEHYKLLAGLVIALKPEVIVEIGTATGLSALAMKKYLPPGSKIATFDVVNWKMFRDTCLRDEDFLDGTLVQHVDDLSGADAVSKHRELLEAADLIFIDAAKDGKMEKKFLDNFKAVSFKGSPLLVFDDIRLWNMLRIWREIPLPKLDLTSFGHWSGTGLVDWKGWV